MTTTTTMPAATAALYPYSQPDAYSFVDSTSTTSTRLLAVPSSNAAGSRSRSHSASVLSETTNRSLLNANADETSPGPAASSSSTSPSSLRPPSSAMTPSSSLASSIALTAFGSTRNHHHYQPASHPSFLSSSSSSARVAAARTLEGRSYEAEHDREGADDDDDAGSPTTTPSSYDGSEGGGNGIDGIGGSADAKGCGDGGSTRANPLIEHQARNLAHAAATGAHVYRASTSAPATVPAGRASLPPQGSGRGGTQHRAPAPRSHHPASYHQLVNFLSSLFPYDTTRALTYGGQLFEVVLPYVSRPFIGALIDVPSVPLPDRGGRGGGGGSRGEGQRRMTKGGRSVHIHFRPPATSQETTGAHRGKSTKSSPSSASASSKPANLRRITPPMDTTNHPASSSSSWSVSGPTLPDAHASPSPAHAANERYAAGSLDIRDHLTSLLDLVIDQLEADELVLALRRKERRDEELGELLHALAYVGGVVLRSGNVLGGFEWDEREWVLVGLEV